MDPESTKMEKQRTSTARKYVANVARRLKSYILGEETTTEEQTKSPASGAREEKVSSPDDSDPEWHDAVESTAPATTLLAVRDEGITQVMEQKSATSYMTLNEKIGMATAEKIDSNIVNRGREDFPDEIEYGPDGREEITDEVEYGPDDQVFRILLVGRTGSGKSASGNTILGVDKFCEGGSFGSVTNECQLERRKRFGRIVEVMDTPGLFDPSKSHDEIASAIAVSVVGVNPGPHAVLYVIQMGQRYTPEEFNTYQRLKAYLDERVTNYMILLLTNADRVTVKKPFKGAPKTFEQVFRECQYRFVQINNKAQPCAKEKSVQELFKKIQDLLDLNGGKHYQCSISRLVENEMTAEINRREREVNERELESNECVQELYEEKKQAEQLAEQNRMQYESMQKQLDDAKEDLTHAFEQASIKEKEIEEKSKELKKRKIEMSEIARQAEKVGRKLREREKEEEEENKRKQMEWQLKQDLIQRRSEEFRKQIDKVVKNHFSVDLKDDVFVCRECGGELGKARDAISIPIRDAFDSWLMNDVSERYKIRVQVVGYKNGRRIQVILLDAALIKGTELRKPPSTNWFEGCDWMHAHCPNCGQHKGWINESVEDCAAHKGRFYELCLGYNKTE